MKENGRLSMASDTPRGRPTEREKAIGQTPNEMDRRRGRIAKHGWRGAGGKLGVRGLMWETKGVYGMEEAEEEVSQLNTAQEFGDVEPCLLEEDRQLEGRLD